MSDDVYNFELAFSENSPKLLTGELLDELTYLNSFCSMIDVPISVIAKAGSHETVAYFNETKSFRIKKILEKLQSICASYRTSIFLDITIYDGSASDKMKVSLKEIQIKEISTKIKKHLSKQDKILDSNILTGLRYKVTIEYSGVRQIII